MAKRHDSSSPAAGDRPGPAGGYRMPVAGPVSDDPRPGSPLLPHEHDESPEIASGPRRKVVKRAQRDLAEGRVDTEARSNAVRHFERAAHRERAPAHVVRARRGRKDPTT